MTTFSEHQYKLGPFAKPGRLGSPGACNKPISMQTTFPKIAAVILAISAIAFMGVSVAAYFGRPNPVAEMGAAEIVEYNFQVSPGAEANWTVAPPNTPAKSVKTPYEAVLFAYSDKSDKLIADTNRMNALTEKLRQQITEARESQAADIAALEKRIETVSRFVAEADAELMKRSQELQKLSVETADIRRETSKRREDVTRLQSELDELRTDKFSLEQIQKTLTDRLIRLQLENQALELRLGK